MNTPTIKCPKCGEVIELAESMAGPILEKMKKDNAERIEAMRQDMVKERTQLRAAIEAEAFEKATALSDTREKELRKTLNDTIKKAGQLEELMEDNNAKLAAAQAAQAAALKQQRELETQRRELELTIEGRVSAEIEKARVEAKWAAENAMDLKVKEKEQQIASMQTVIAELKQKSEQGSMQVQGEVQELELEKVLRAKFPFDVIAEVDKGINGADCIQEVKDASGTLCGSIIWESKRTKSWSDGWLVKLRDDQRSAKSDIAILVTQVLPKEVKSFDIIDGVWVCKLETAVPLACALRQSLLEVANAKESNKGVKSKTEMLYSYLTGLQFKQRVQAIVEAFTTMQEDLFREKKAITKSWAKREEQITNVMESTVGMYGDIQGIAGKAVKEIPGLDVRQIEKDDD